MRNPQSSVLNRDDTLLGVCEALGEDFGFNPIWLRITFATLLLWNPVVILSTYIGIGIVIAISRWIAPNPRVAETNESVTGLEHEPTTVEASQGELALAA